MNYPQNCIDNNCKHSKAIIGDWICELNQEGFPDLEICPNFEQAKNCLTCSHARTTVYETGTIDDIEYRCEFQGRTLIYDDSNVMNEHHSDIPECNCGKWQHD